MTLVRQSAKREKLPDVLELDELKKLLAELENPVRALVFLTAATGLRVTLTSPLVKSGSAER